MPDYYEQLEAQLTALTERGAHRRRRRSIAKLPGRWPVRGELMAVAASVLIVVAVAVAVLGTRASHHHSRRPPTVSHRTSGPAVLHNIYPAALPAPLGELVCESPLTASGRHASHQGGEVRFYSAPPVNTEMFFTARGLRHISRRDRYAVWLLPAAGTLSGAYVLQHGAAPQLLGFIEPPVGTAGRVTVTGVLTASVQGIYKLLLTVQRNSSSRTPGVTVLQGFVNF
jgi:hypothetical protein